MSRPLQIVIDAHDPDRLAAFWAEALGYVIQPPPAGFDSWEAFATAHQIPREKWASALIDPGGAGPRVFFPTVPEAKQVKNRVHLDVFVSGAPDSSAEDKQRRIAAEVARLEGLGGTKVREGAELGSYWTVMLDPEGNEFCVH